MQEDNDVVLHFYEGYLRNQKQLCKELAVRPEEDRNETEKKLICRAYAKWGKDLAAHLHGAYAFLVWDEKPRELVAFRDPLGIRSVYYALLPDGELLCAPDIGTITDDARYQKELDAEALQLYMMFGYPIGEKTLFRGIKKLMPGQILIGQNGTYRIKSCERTWPKPEVDRSEAKWIRQIEQTMKTIVEEDQTNFDFLRGCSFLSSGVDSSYLLASTGLRYSCGIGYEETGFSEAEDAKKTAKRLGTQYEELRITSDRFFADLPKVIRNMGLPTADASTAAFAIGCQQLAGRYDFFLSGEGADEFFAGYHVYQRASELGKKEALYLGCDGIMEQDAAMALLKQDDRFPCENLLKDISELPDDSDELMRMLLVDQSLWLEGDILFGAGRAAKAAGLELLMPYADDRMQKLAAQIPSSLLHKDGCGKYIFRKTAMRILPEEIAFRNKIGFRVPIRLWMREERHRRRIEEKLFGEVSESFFDPNRLRRYWDAFCEGNDEQWHILYAVFVFVLWYEECWCITVP